MTSYQLYRNTTLGHTLQETLDDYITLGQISNSLSAKILVQFDRSVSLALSTRIKTRLNFKAPSLKTYRFCDNVWTFVLRDVEFRESSDVFKVDKVKIVACDGKSATGTRDDRD